MTMILQIVALIAGFALIALILFSGFSGLNRRLDAVLKSAGDPLIAVIGDVENTIALVNIGNGVAIDILWTLSTGELGTISHLSPRQSSHVHLPEQQGGDLSLSYKSISGELFSRRFNAARLLAGDGHLALA